MMNYKIPHKVLDVLMKEARKTNTPPFQLIEAAILTLYNKESKKDHEKEELH